MKLNLLLAAGLLAASSLSANAITFALDGSVTITRDWWENEEHPDPPVIERRWRGTVDVPALTFGMPDGDHWNLAWDMQTTIYDIAEGSSGFARIVGGVPVAFGSTGEMFRWNGLEVSVRRQEHHGGGWNGGATLTPLHVTPVPEPATIALMVGGLAGLIWRRRSAR